MDGDRTGALQGLRGHGRQPHGVWLLNGSRADRLRGIPSAHRKLTGDRARPDGPGVSPPARRPGAQGRGCPVQCSACLPDGQPLRLEADIRHAGFTVDAAQPLVAADPVPPAHGPHPRRCFRGGTAAAAIDAGAAALRTTAGRQTHRQQEEGEPPAGSGKRRPHRERGTARPSRGFRAPHSPAGRWAPPPGRSAGRCAAG